jgi:hypothetical protein
MKLVGARTAASVLPTSRGVFHAGSRPPRIPHQANSSVRIAMFSKQVWHPIQYEPLKVAVVAAAPL